MAILQKMRYYYYNGITFTYKNYDFLGNMGYTMTFLKGTQKPYYIKGFGDLL